MKPVIVVDDEEELRLALVYTLSKDGIKANAFSNGLEAIAFINQLNTACLLITDFVMPKMNGLELVWRTKESAAQKNLVHDIIMISGSADAHELAKKEGLGFLSKPFSIRQVRELLKNYGIGKPSES